MPTKYDSPPPPRFSDLPTFLQSLLSVAKSHFHVERVNAGVSFETFPYLVVNDFAILKLNMLKFNSISTKNGSW